MLYLFLAIFTIYGLGVYYLVSTLFEKHKFLSNPKVQYSTELNGFTRDDYPRWNKTSFFLCALFLLPIRCIIAVGCILMSFLKLKFLTWIFCIKDLSKPQNIWFLRISKLVLQVYMRTFLFAMGYYWIPKKMQKADPGNLEYFDQFEDKKHATIVSNHVSFTDIFFYASLSKPIGFVSNHLIIKYPLIGIMAQIIQCVFVDRKNKNSRSKCFDDMKNRIESVKKNPKSKWL